MWLSTDVKLEPSSQATFSSVYPVNGMTTWIFNGVSGLGRSPVGHTCDCWLELSTTYYTYPEFKHEFLNILNGAVAWPMDAV